MSDVEQPSNATYLPVEIYELRVGKMVERPLYMYLSSNKRYILVAKALHPLEQSVYDKLRRFGSIFSSRPAIEREFPQLAEAVREAKKACENQELAAFERNRAILLNGVWLAQQILETGPDTIVPLIFFQRVFGAPKHETLQYLSDLSIVVYERALKISATAGVIALFLGYSDAAFLARYAETLFCEEAGRFENGVPAGLGSPLTAKERQASLNAIAGKKIPGMEPASPRIQMLVSRQRNSLGLDDELLDIADYARSLIGEPSIYAGRSNDCRIAHKLKKLIEAGLEDAKKRGPRPMEAA